MPLIQSNVTDSFSLVDGMNTVKSGIRIDATEVRDAVNINWFPVGGFSSRSGYSKLNTATSSVNPNTGLYQARFSSPSLVAIRVCGTKLEKMEDLDGTWDDITGSLTITNNQDKTWTFAMLNDIVVGANDTDTCIQINSSLTAAVLSGTPPFTSALGVCEHRGYMFAYNTVESSTRQPDRLRFSAINNPNSFAANDFIDVAKKQGGDVRGLVDYATYLYVFKRHGIYQINYQPTRVNSSGSLFPFIEVANPVVPGVGTQSPRSIVKFTTPSTHKTPGQELVFFVDQFGIPRIFDGQTTLTVGEKIRSSRDTTIRSLSDMDRSRNGQIFCVNYPGRNQLWCFMTRTNTKNDTCWVLDYTTGFAWSRHAFNDTFNCAHLMEKSDGTFKVYTGDYAGYVYAHDTGTNDSGQAISWYVQGGDVYNQSPVVNSAFESMEVRGTSGSTSQTLTIQTYRDGSSTPIRTDTVTLADSQTTWGSFIWGQDTWGKQGLVTRTQELNIEAKTLALKLSDSTLDATHVIEGFSTFSRPMGSKQA